VCDWILVGRWSVVWCLSFFFFFFFFGVWIRLQWTMGVKGS
jgi:hypothetical protein